jgi:putative ABC transport system substrate-binding protein
MPVGPTNRRSFITALGGAAAWPMAARAQQQGQPILHVGAIVGWAKNDPEVKSYINAFDKGLRELGWRDGRNVILDFHYAAGDIEEMRKLTREIVASKPDLIFASSTPIATALHSETQTIPVVFVVVSDPVGAGIVESLSRPGGNCTGLLNIEASMSGKWVELLHEAAPGLRRVAIVFNPDTAPGGGSYFAGAFEAAAQSFGLMPMLRPVHDDADIRDLISEFERGDEPGGVVVMTDSFMFVHRNTVITESARARVPTVYPLSVDVHEGGLLSYGASNIDLFRRAAIFVDRILRGTNPRELPVEVPTKFELAVNLNTAKALGLDLPSSLIARADEVIE